MEFTLGPSCTYRRSLVSDIGIIPTDLDRKLPTSAIKRLEYHSLIPFQGISYTGCGWFYYQENVGVVIEDLITFEAVYLNYRDKLNRAGYNIPLDSNLLNILGQGYTVCLYVTRHLVLREYIELMPVSSHTALFTPKSIFTDRLVFKDGRPWDYD